MTTASIVEHFYVIEDVGTSLIAGSVDALVANWDAVETAPGGWRLSLFLALDLRARFFEGFSQTVAEDSHWRYVMRFVWLPGSRAYVGDPRFLEIMGEAGIVALWEQRGYPDSCVRVSDPAGDRLDCAQR